MQDIRWIQRYDHFKKALVQVKDAAILRQSRDLSALEKQGVIQAFEYTHELAWKTLKDFLIQRGHTEIYGSRDATREAFSLGLLEEGEVWMEMIKSRNLTSHTYDQATADLLVERVFTDYLEAFKQLDQRLSILLSKEG